MIKINENGFTVHISAQANAETAYVETFNDLISAIQERDQQFETRGNFYLLELMRGMLPTPDQARKMFDSKSLKKAV